MITIKNKAEDLARLIEMNRMLPDIPECIMEATEENDMLLDLIFYTVDSIQKNLITEHFLTYTEVLNLYDMYLTRLQPCIDYEFVGEVKEYLNNKLFKIMNYAIENELFEVMSNFKHWQTIKNELVKIDFI